MTRTTVALDQRLHAYLLLCEPPEHEQLRKLRDRTGALPKARLQIAPEQGHLLAFLVRLTGARRILEVGTFTGYSALAMALALPAEGRIITCDIDADWVGIGRPFWESANVSDRIDVRIGRALETLAGLDRDGVDGFDLVFIDSNKDDYDGYYEAALRLARPGGLIVLDNMFQGGRVADPDNSEPWTTAIRTLNVKIAGDQRVDRAVIPVGDGMTLVRLRP